MGFCWNLKLVIPVAIIECDLNLAKFSYIRQIINYKIARKNIMWEILLSRLFSEKMSVEDKPQGFFLEGRHLAECLYIRKVINYETCCTINFMLV